MHMQNLWRALGALVLGGAVGCTVPDSMLNLRSDGGSDAIDLKGVDLAIGVGQIGAACKQKADCTMGTAPTCWVNNVLDQPGNLPTNSGYCTSTCTSDADCGGYGTCQTIQSGQPKYCLRTCYLPNTCRTDQSFGCFPLTAQMGYCYPTTRLTCNPTIIDPATKNGTCPSASPPSACVRRTFEDKGECLPLCDFAGTMSCDATHHCVFFDATVDSKGKPTRDTFKGLTCMENPQNPKVEGQDCSYVDECARGYQCNNVLAGDYKCRELCIVGDSTICPNDKTCRDVFKAGPGQPGLCTPNQ